MKRGLRFWVARVQQACLYRPGALEEISSAQEARLRGGQRPPLQLKLRVSCARGFTLLEMCIVLLIIALLAAATMPAFESAINEHRVREDGHQLALMVRTAMIQSAEQHRPYVIALTANTMSLHPVGEENAPAQDSDAALFKDSGGTNADHPVEDVITENVDVEKQLEDTNKLEAPDPGKANAWIDLPADGTQWIFQPGELCPATPIRVASGDAYLEMNFEALTGNIESEKSYFP
jgi:prepilin-type N-terminal cleavage/methylation domain-containing protein